ncbi:cytochrome ubiquinol oxidase subunit II [Palleronia sp. LCG004]|uniref:cytochrome ubiquinol oxidase subunit II n=1 Tax=Palleronia sp. LCG004 TaxID=3079304 RepID=UPI00294378FD|nr:cytochrome ubiquinol oxidase subunit II [Palleronia sp. LCG004]WOI56626.1 cytochrome ubiquinol oxidase subunit II [Palleronia sp. LCG004]
MTPRPLPRRVRVASLSALGAIVGGTAIADTASFLDPLGPIAEFQRVELIWAAIMIFVAIAPVFVGVPWIMWRYRRSNRNAGYAPGWGHDNRLEAVMWGVPVVIIIALGIWLTQATFRIDPYRKIDIEMARSFDFDLSGPPVAVETVGLDWKWLHLYPEEGIATVGGMVIPVDRPVSMRLTTDTVMQSYMAPGLAGQIYAMPGMVTELNFIADRVGRSISGNTQYNGPGFARQRAQVISVPGDEYLLWLAEARNAPPLDDAAYARLAKSGTLDDARAEFDRPGEGPLIFSLPDDRLFTRIVARYTSGEAVAHENQPGSPFYDAETARLPDLPAAMAAHGHHAPVPDGGICTAPEPYSVANLEDLAE